MVLPLPGRIPENRTLSYPEERGGWSIVDLSLASRGSRLARFLIDIQAKNKGER
jgi:hypothetical protein